ncbi:hypothetical protein PHMEG_00029140 [Phytophthora megakarya]|uniref:Uncharacterized protein n=1 Tax=Phytophthora megakarya TaxID=4795 RepID=A0A225V3B1_9STRA|nr:hypothetical protein PHMEG_00029140 [Phytophthora megakarya]
MNAYYTTKEEIFHTPMGYAVTNNPCETFNALLKKYTGRRRYYMQRLLKISQKVVHDAKILQPTRENSMLPPPPTVVKAANSMISTGRLVNASLCRVKHVRSPSEVSEANLLEEFCVTMEEPFRAASETSETQEESELLLGPALLVRVQRARAAKLYKNVVTWSLQRAHTT